MARVSSNKSYLVFAVSYEYDDLEENQHFKFLEYFKNYDDAIAYLIDIGKENNMLENAFYRCRQNIKIKIFNKHVTNVSLFKFDEL